MFLKTNWVCLSKNTQIYTDKQSKDLNTFLPIKISAKKKSTRALRVGWKYFCFVLIVTFGRKHPVITYRFLETVWYLSLLLPTLKLQQFLLCRTTLFDWPVSVCGLHQVHHKTESHMGERERSALNMINGEKKKKLKINKWCNWVFKEQVKSTEQMTKGA